MAGLYPDSGSQSDTLSLTLPDSGLHVDKFTSYSFDSDFLSPADGWTFEVGGTESSLTPQLVAALRTGDRMFFKVNGKTQGGGIIDAVDARGSRGAGSTITVHGRDVFGPVVDSGADRALYTFQPSQTLEDVVKAVFSKFNFTTEDEFLISNDANRSVMTGVRTTTKKGRALKSYRINQQLQPYPAEGLFAFLTRYLHRQGLWCWPSADQSTVVVDVPHFDLPAYYSIVRKRDGSLSNVLDGGVVENATNQPSAIVATGTSGGGDVARSRYKVIYVNELTGLVVDRSSTSTEMFPTPDVLDLIARHPDAVYVPPRDVFQGYLKSLARPSRSARSMFLHDDDAKDLSQLKAFARKEMSLRQQHMWLGHYVVRGHTQNGRPWAVDTIVDVQDEEPPGRGFSGPMWVRGRTFNKSRASGTTTSLRLCLPNTLEFGSEE